MKFVGKSGAAAGIVCAAAIGAHAAHADVILSGPDANDGSYSTAALAAFASANPGITVGADGLTGVSLWGLLGGANSSSPTSPSYGAITTSTPAGDNGKNAILRYYVLGTSDSGARSVVSLGEIDPAFGGTAPLQIFIAYADAGNALLATPQLVVPGGAGRDLSSLASLQLLAVPALPAGPGGPSTAVTLSGDVKNPGSYTKADLQSKFTPTTETVSGDTYTGVPLWDFIGSNDSDVTDQLVVTAGTDGYEVVLSLAELDPALGGNPQNLLPYADTGTDFPPDGVARTILPNDNKHGRWESNLDSVDVVTVPEPGTIPLFLSGVAALFAVRPRRSRTI